MAWAESIATTARNRPLLAIIIAVLTLSVLVSAYGGVTDWFAKRAEIQTLKDDVAEAKKKGAEAKEFADRAIAAKDAALIQISTERDALRKKIKAVQAAKRDWKIPATDNELLTRFKALGY